MDLRLRRRYLDALGVPMWRLRRDTAAGAVTAVPEPAERPQGMPGYPQDPIAATEPPAGLVRPDCAVPPIPGEGRSVSEMDWDELREAVSSCRACGLCETRTQTVFGVGNRSAQLMVVGEAPGADEDRQGEPFVGRAGRLLNLMLQAVGLRREQVYIANILKCRPPGNRDPRPEEALRCEAFLTRQLALVRPRVLLSVGRVSAQHLLRTDTPIGRLRGRWHLFGPDRTPLMVTYHPAYLLRSPEAKEMAWRDLLEVIQRLRSGERGSSPESESYDHSENHRDF